MVAAMIVVTIAIVGMLNLSGASAASGEQAANNGLSQATGAATLHGPVIAIRGDIDVDGDDSINLAGSDTQAITKIKFVLAAELANGIDLTPPSTVDETGIDPDTSGLTSATTVSITTGEVSLTETAWSVEFVGDNDGDNFLETGERAELTVWIHQNDLANSLFDLGAGVSDEFIDVEGDLLIARGLFTIRVIPRNAPATTITRTLPIELTSTILLD